MKAVAYSIKPFEKEFLAKANQKKHDITLISNALTCETASYAKGKDAVIVFTNDNVSADVIDKLAELGIKFIVTRSVDTDHIDKTAAAIHGIKLSNIPAFSSEAVAEHAVALAFALNRQLIPADSRTHLFNFKNDGLTGFNFFGKTVGLIGLGHVGQAAAQIFNGIGCKVIGFDVNFPEEPSYIQSVTLENLLASADIISLHIPLTSDTKHIIQNDTIQQMKNGVMLINTSRGALIKTKDILLALKSGKVGYLGLDVYEHDKELFFEDHRNDKVKDPLLIELLKYPNVLITPHLAYLTTEALQEMANRTIKNLDLWQMNKYADIGGAKDYGKNNSDLIQNNKINAK